MPPRPFNERSARYPGADRQIYGLHQPYDRGYGVDRNIDPAKKGANGYLINQIEEDIAFWIDEMEASFQMGGKTAQSHRTRQFFPHTMQQPTVTVRGTSPDSYQYNRLASFVRASQVYAVSSREFRQFGVTRRRAGAVDIYTGANTTQETPTVRLLIEAGGVRTTRRIQKGRNRPWLLEGYIKSMQAGAEKESHAPTFEFEFVISQSIRYNGGREYGIYHDTAVTGLKVLNWMDIFRTRDVADPTKGTAIKKAHIKNAQKDNGDSVLDIVDDVTELLKDIF